MEYTFDQDFNLSVKLLGCLTVCSAELLFFANEIKYSPWLASAPLPMVQHLDRDAPAVHLLHGGQVPLQEALPRLPALSLRRVQEAASYSNTGEQRSLKVVEGRSTLSRRVTFCKEEQDRPWQSSAEWAPAGHWFGSFWPNHQKSLQQGGLTAALCSLPSARARWEPCIDHWH